MLAYAISHIDSLKARARKLAGDRKGVLALEYGLVAGVIVLTIAVGFASFADALSTKFNAIGAGL